MCPIECGMDMIGGKWKLRILCIISSKKGMRYSKIKRELIGIADTVLASMLKELIACNLLSRKAYDEMPLRVEYSLTEDGESLLRLLHSVFSWTNNHYEGDRENGCTACKACPFMSEAS